MPRWAFLILTLLVAGAAAAGLWILGNRVPGREGSVTSTGVAAVGGPFSLTDQFAHARTEKDYSGRFILVYFGYTNCPDVCPTTLSVIADALEKMGGAAPRVVPVFITVDPARDTPAALKAYLAAFGPSFVGLTGPAQNIAKAEAEYRVFVSRHDPQGSGYAVDHSNIIYLMGPDGKFIASFDETLGPDKLAAELLARM